MPDPVSASRMARWIKVALVVSLAINLLVLGAAIGAAVGHDRMRDGARPEMTRDFVRSPLLSALAEDDRRAVGRDLMREGGAMGQNRAELRDRFERLLVALRAEPFDRSALEAILAEQRAVGARRLEIAEEAVLSRLASMPPEARAAYAARLDRSLRRDR